MLFALEEDGLIYVYETVEAAVLQVEALDAEETFRTVFDETGQTYAIEWIRPNGYGWLLVENGEYTLRPTGKKDVAGFLRVLQSANGIEPGEEDRVREVQARLIGAGTSEPESP